MGKYISNRDSDGLTDENGHFRLPLKVLDGNILSGLEVSSTSTPSMSVVISAGDAKIPYSDYSYAVWSDSTYTVTIATANTSYARIDRIVAYVDRMMSFSNSTVNHPDGLKFMAVSGTASANPVAPTDNQVQTAVGATNPFIDLGQVNVPAGATIITSANINTTGRKGLSISKSVQNSNITATNGANLQFVVINEGQSLPSAIPGTTLVVLVAKN